MGGALVSGNTLMPPAIPTATYRLQLTANFDFDAARAVIPYLKALGISHVYASPLTKARKGSTHGYDVVNHTIINPELGGEEGFEQLSQTLRQHGLGLILDFVPNHVGVHFADNPWWLDMLEWGEASPHADSFDIDWEQLPYRARGGVLLPILGSSYGQALEKGEIELRYDPNEGSFSAWYFEHRLPIAPERYGEILHMIVKATGLEENPAGKRLLDLASRYEGLRHPNRQEAPAFKTALKQIEGSAELVESGLPAYRAGPGRPSETLVLHHLLERQHYKLGHWRLASSDINYRRFFDVNSLAGLRVEHAGTFNVVHRLVRKLVEEGKLQGLRLDHIDGLQDPAQYFARLTRLIRQAAGKSAKSFYVVVEKILAEHETLRSFAGIHGTTGYEALNTITRALIDGRGLDALDETWRQISNASPALSPVLKAGKRRVLETLLTSEFTVLARLLARIAAGHYSTRDFSADSLRQALELYVLNFPIYRTYLTAAGVSDGDRALISDTIEKARAEWFASDEGIFDFLRDVLTMDLAKPGGGLHSAPRIRRFALKVQQFTGPLMAKSLEDTVFYRMHRLLALNEVGGEPSASALSTDEFHRRMKDRARDWPHAMTATATHDTKRGEDARARLMSLTELPGEWTSAVARWKILNAAHVITIGDLRAPSATFEYMLYQTLLGAWPFEGIDDSFTERIQAYAVKAAREGKQETSWLKPHAVYEQGVGRFIAKILDRSISAEFIDSMDHLARRIALLGALNSLSQITLKATMPGMPDFYQGTEFWDLAMVDPDNRRPVDFAERMAALKTTERLNWQALTHDWQDGRIKLAWMRHLLKVRSENPDLFAHGQYQPLEVSGRHRDHVIAFARRHGHHAIISAAARWFAPLSNGGRAWPRGDAFDGVLHVPGYGVEGAGDQGAIPLSTLFRLLPVTVLSARPAGTTRRARRKMQMA
jgi:(1->4)-alpha-D-glucan 1-alpha-D-glucosylmutase